MTWGNDAERPGEEVGDSLPGPSAIPLTARLPSAAQMRETVERELKLEAAADFELPALPGAEIDRVFTSTYVDTPARSLTAAGITLRRRLENRRSLWQLKLPRSGARAELEARGGPAGPPPELAALLTVHTRRHGELAPITVLRTRRRGVHVVEGDRDVAEVTVDRVDVLEGRRRVDGFVRPGASRPRAPRRRSTGVGRPSESLSGPGDHGA